MISFYNYELGTKHITLGGSLSSQHILDKNHITSIDIARNYSWKLLLLSMVLFNIVGAIDNSETVTEEEKKLLKEKARRKRKTLSAYIISKTIN